MSSDHLSCASQGSATAPSGSVTLSPYVNEPLPAWGELLSAHDVARLTRRPRWLLASLVLLGQFPKKCRYHGRGIGWLRSDVLSWLTRDLKAGECRVEKASIARRRISRQDSLPMEYPCAARDRRGPCSARRGDRVGGE